MISKANVAKVISFSHATKEVLHELFGSWRKSLTSVLGVGYEHNVAIENIVEIQELAALVYVFNYYTWLLLFWNIFKGLKAFDEVKLLIIILVLSSSNI